jgi:hypothetical protein
MAALVGMTLVSAIAALWAGAAEGIPAARVLIGYAISIWLMIPVAAFLLLVSVFVRGAILRIPEPLSELKPFLKGRFGSPATAVGTLGPILLLPLLMASFGTIKQIIPILHPFAWDDVLANADRALFLGVQPWEWTHALFGSPEATVFIDRLYSGWVPLLPLSVLGFALLAPGYLRARFFLSYAAAWLLIGVVGALVFSSAGPCYADAIGAAAARDYAPLMVRLNAIHQTHFLTAVDWQQHLWKAHVGHHYGFGLGISAMPSMHNAVSFLYLLMARRATIVLRMTVYAFTAMIFVGSVHLGWHYAVDGLAAWATMAAIWYGTGLYLRRIGYHDTDGARADPAPAPALATASAAS